LTPTHRQYDGERQRIPYPMGGVELPQNSCNTLRIKWPSCSHGLCACY